MRKATNFLVVGALLLTGCSFYARGPDEYRKVVREVLDTRSAQIQSCYKSELASDASAGGRVVVKFDVEPKTGNFAAPSIDKRKTQASEGLQNCVLHSLDGLAIKPPDQRKGEAIFAWDFTR